MLQKNKIVLLGIVFILTILFCLYSLPIVNKVLSEMQMRATTVALRNDYKSITTPLPASVVEDICLKLNIMASSDNCQSDMPVYAPDFFDEIETYFGDVPRNNRTYDFVQERLGIYLDYCATPYPNGDYRCVYDLRGDRLYPVYFYFDKDDHYFRIIANWDRQDS